MVDVPAALRAALHADGARDSPRLEAPELTRELRDAVVEGCEDEADGRSVAALVNERDKGLIAVIKALRTVGVGTTGDGGLHGA